MAMTGRRRFLPVSWVLLATFLSVGCEEKGPQAYVSKRGEYTFKYPGGWRFIEDDRKLTKAREKINEKNGAKVKFDFNPDVVFVGGEMLGGMVVITPVPIFTKEATVSEADEEKVYESLEAVQRALGKKPRNTKKININNKKFVVNIFANDEGNKTMTAVTLHERRVYGFQFSCAEAESYLWFPVFKKHLKSISFEKQDIEAAKKTEEDQKDDFFTGLWHGALVLFRIPASYIWDFKIYSENNTGTGYLIGFILGIMLITGGVGGSTRE